MASLMPERNEEQGRIFSGGSGNSCVIYRVAIAEECCFNSRRRWPDPMGRAFFSPGQL